MLVFIFHKKMAVGTVTRTSPTPHHRSHLTVAKGVTTIMRPGTGAAPLAVAVLTLDANTQAEVYLFGATLTSWRRRGEEQLFLRSAWRAYFPPSSSH